MVDIRFHGLEGQEAQASAELTALAAMARGKYAQTFPCLEADQGRTPGAAYVRVSDTPIRARKKANSPDVVVILDTVLSHSAQIIAGLKTNGLVIINTKKSVDQIRKETGIKTRLGVADASGSALEINDIPVGDSTTLESLIMASHVHSEETHQPVSETRLGGLAEQSLAAYHHAFNGSFLEAPPAG